MDTMKTTNTGGNIELPMEQVAAMDETIGADRINARAMKNIDLHAENKGCPVCGKKTALECSHIDCPNRRRITAAPCVDAFSVPSCGGSIPPRNHGGQS